MYILSDFVPFILNIHLPFSIHISLVLMSMLSVLLNLQNIPIKQNYLSFFFKYFRTIEKKNLNINHLYSAVNLFSNSSKETAWTSKTINIKNYKNCILKFKQINANLLEFIHIDVNQQKELTTDWIIMSCKTIFVNCSSLPNVQIKLGILDLLSS